MRQSKDRLILSFITVGTLVAIISLQSGRRINPIGWYDFNQDSIKDALVIEPINRNYAQLGFIDGDSVYKSNGQFRTKAQFQRFDLPQINYDSRLIYSAIIEENQENSFTLHINAHDEGSNLESSVGIYENVSLGD